MIAGFFDSDMNKLLASIASIITIVGAVSYWSPAGSGGAIQTYTRPQPRPISLHLERVSSARNLIAQLRSAADRQQVAKVHFIDRWVPENGWFCFVDSWPTADNESTSDGRTWSIHTTEALLKSKAYYQLGLVDRREYWYTERTGGVRVRLNHLVNHMDRREGDQITVWGKVVEIGDIDGAGYVVLDSAWIDAGFVGNEFPVR